MATLAHSPTIQIFRHYSVLFPHETYAQIKILNLIFQEKLTFYYFSKMVADKDGGRL